MPDWKHVLVAFDYDMLMELGWVVEQEINRRNSGVLQMLLNAVGEGLAAFATGDTYVK